MSLEAQTPGRIFSARGFQESHVQQSIVENSNCKFGHGDEQALTKQPQLEGGKEPSKNLLLKGQVTILKRGKALKPNTNDTSQRKL